MNAQTGTSDKQSPGETLAKSATKLSRMDYVKALINRAGEEKFSPGLEKDFRIEPYILDRPDSVRELSKAECRRHDRSAIDLQTTDHQRAAHRDRQRLRRSGPAPCDEQSGRLVMFSDFGNNNGPAPAGTADSPVKRLGVPVYAVGIGPQTAVDLATELEMPRQLKKAERQEIKVILRQTGLDGRRAKVTVVAGESWAPKFRSEIRSKSARATCS